ncbi:hypothetical protein [Mesorhizobium sp.]|uniref:hypothetical protein n=1 Tax=Mesorhizobium sp. TaxID=1871066 RepID=UPI000FE30693|nr:hypothetical protein [Mesorhizobium sp.]RWJ96998.1 MAG: hypothetical protein EOR42_29415 [Mesorhizobium sp.]
MPREISLDRLDRQLELLLSKVEALHRLVEVLPSQPPPPSTPDQPRFVTIEFFVKDMLGFKHRVSYYDHKNDPGWPQRAYPAGPGSKPMLVYDECVAYQRLKMAERDPLPLFKRPGPPEGKKRHVGRPAKVPRRS